MSGCRPAVTHQLVTGILMLLPCTSVMGAGGQVLEGRGWTLWDRVGAVGCIRITDAIF